MKNILKYWTPEEFEISSYNPIKNKINGTFTKSGSDQSGLCTYNYNELGFRGDSVKKNGFKVMSLGCSFTEGTGVNDDETWPAQFTSYIPNGVNMNFGVGARSNDFISRCLLTYFDIIKPDLVLIMYTVPHRRELYTPNCGIEAFIPSTPFGYTKETKEGKEIHGVMTLAQNDYQDIDNWYRNHQLISLFMEKKKCNWLWNGSMIDYDYKDALRFDGNFRPQIDFAADDGHQGPKTNYLYAKRLFEHIKNYFPHYIPDTASLKMNKPNLI
jgi:hypothetical protein